MFIRVGIEHFSISTIIYFDIGTCEKDILYFTFFIN